MVTNITREINGMRVKIGAFDEKSKTLYINRNKKKHFHRKTQSWGIDWDKYKELRMIGGLENVVITDFSLGEGWKIDQKTIHDHRFFMHFPPHGLQMFVPEKYWVKGGATI
jgi:hypothetical protein